MLTGRPGLKIPYYIYSNFGGWGDLKVVLICLAVWLLLKSIVLDKFDLPVVVFSVGLLVYQGVDRIWAIPSGLYMNLISISLLGVFREASQRFSLLRVFSGKMAYCLSCGLMILYFFAVPINSGRP